MIDNETPFVVQRSRRKTGVVVVDTQAPLVTYLGVGLSRLLTFAKVLTNALESLPCAAVELSPPDAASAGLMANISVALMA